MHDLFNSVDSAEWIEALPDYQRSGVEALLADGQDAEAAAAALLTIIGDPRTSPLGGGSRAENYVAAVQAEIRKLICGDPTYDGLRNQISEQWDKGKLYIVGIVAASIGTLLGVTGVILVPVISLLFAAISQIGTNAWCATGQ